MVKAQSPLLTGLVEQVAWPATVACLCCRGWVGVQAQGIFFGVSSGFARVSRNRVGLIPPKCATFSDFSPRLWSSFFEVLSFQRHVAPGGC